MPEVQDPLQVFQLLMISIFLQLECPATLSSMELGPVWLVGAEMAEQVCGSMMRGG